MKEVRLALTGERRHDAEAAPVGTVAVCAGRGEVARLFGASGRGKKRERDSRGDCGSSLFHGFPNGIEGA